MSKFTDDDFSRYAPDVNPDLIFANSSKGEMAPAAVDDNSNEVTAESAVNAYKEASEALASVMDEESGKKRRTKNSASGSDKKGKELVDIFIPADHVSGIAEIKISINCVDYVIPLGERVQVPAFVREFWENMEKNRIARASKLKNFEDADK